MLRWLCVILTIAIVAVSVIECVAHLTPLEQLTSVLGRGDGPAGGDGRTVIRLGVASWQFDEFPWRETVARYEADHPGVKIKVSACDGSVNTMLLFWASGHTEYDALVCWSDGEFHAITDYNWTSEDPDRRGLAINVRDWLTESQQRQFAQIMPALLEGCSKVDRCGMDGKRVTRFNVLRDYSAHVIPFCGESCAAAWDRLDDARKRSRYRDVLNVYELPWMGEVLALNYNRQYFRQAGIDAPPRTWEEVEQDCKKLQGLEHNGVKVAPLAWNWSQTGFFTQNCYVPMLAAYKKGRGIADARGRLDISSPEAVAVFETLKRWSQAGYVSSNCMVNDSVEQDLRVLRAAMYPHWQSRGLWAVKDHGGEVIGIAPSPGSVADNAGSLVATYGCVIPKCSPHIREAVDFCFETFLTDKYGFQTAVANGFDDPLAGHKGGGKMPVMRGAYHGDIKLQPGIADLEPELDRGYTYVDPANGVYVAQILVAEFQKYLSGTTPTAEEALKIAQKRVDEEVYGQ